MILHKSTRLCGLSVINQEIVIFSASTHLSVSVGNTAQGSQVGARRVGLDVRMKCLLSPVLGG